MLRRFLALALTLVVCVPALAETVDKDTPSTTPGGATFTIPAGWTATTKGTMVVLDPPEPDTHIALVDVAGKDAEAAVTAAWAAYKPDFKRPLKIAQPLEPRQGWDERKVFQYETSPNERVVVVSTAHGLKFAEQKTAYHMGLIPGLPSTYANRPLEIGPDPRLVHDAIRRHADKMRLMEA